MYHERHMVKKRVGLQLVEVGGQKIRHRGESQWAGWLEVLSAKLAIVYFPFASKFIIQ